MNKYSVSLKTTYQQSHQLYNYFYKGRKDQNKKRFERNLISDITDSAFIYGSDIEIRPCGYYKLAQSYVFKSIQKILLKKLNQSRYEITVFGELDKVAMNTVGVDFGIVNLITLSDGTKYKFPTKTKQMIQHYRKEPDKGTKNTLIDMLDKEAESLAYKTYFEYAYVCIEDLGKLDVLDEFPKADYHFHHLFWNQYTDYLRHIFIKNPDKGLKYIDPFMTSQICSHCGKRSMKELKNRIFTCHHCKHSIDRDVNAALNIRNRGLQQIAA